MNSNRLLQFQKTFPKELDSRWIIILDNERAKTSSTKSASGLKEVIGSSLIFSDLASVTTAPFTTFNPGTFPGVQGMIISC